jgi:hypothetical protein
LHLPLSRLSLSEIQREVITQELVAEISGATLWRWLSADAPVHASWLNQIEIYFSIVQRKVLTPNDFKSLSELEQRWFSNQPNTEGPYSKKPVC